MMSARWLLVALVASMTHSRAEVIIHEATVATAVEGRVADSSLELQLTNDELCPTTREISFTLPARSRITAMVMTSGSCSMNGTVDELQAASQAHDSAASSGQASALLESYNTTSYRLDISLPGNGSASVTVSFYELLNRRNGIVNFKVPLLTTMAAEHISTHLSVPETGSGVRTFYFEPATIPHVAVSHRGSGCASAAGCTFVVEQPSQVVGMGLLQTIDVFFDPGPLPEEGVVLADDHGYFMHVFNPPSLQQDGMPRDIVFAIDVSGSMMGERLESAKQAFAGLMDLMTEEDLVKVQTFSSSGVESEFGPFSGTKDERAAAHDFVMGLEATGSTNLHDAYIEGLHTLKGERSGALSRMLAGLGMTLAALTACALLARYRRFLHARFDNKTDDQPAESPEPPQGAVGQAMMIVTVPAAAVAGHQLQVFAPNGATMSVIVPPGAPPGTQISVPLPVPPPPPRPLTAEQKWRGTAQCAALFAVVLLAVGVTLLVLGCVGLAKPRMGNADRGAVPLLVLMTDGQPTTGIESPQKIVESVTNHNSDVQARIYGLAFGAGADFETLLAVSVLNGGKAARIYDGYAEDDASWQMQAEVSAQVGSVLCADVEISVTSAASYAVTVGASVLALGSEIVHFGRPLSLFDRRLSDGQLQVKTRGRARGGDFQAVVSADLGDAQLAPGALAKGYAFEQIAELEHSEEAFRRAGRRSEASEARAEALQLALEFGIVWPGLTAMVANPQACPAVASGSCDGAGSPGFGTIEGSDAGGHQMASGRRSLPRAALLLAIALAEATRNLYL